MFSVTAAVKKFTPLMFKDYLPTPAIYSRVAADGDSYRAGKHSLAIMQRFRYTLTGNKDYLFGLVVGAYGENEDDDTAEEVLTLHVLPETLRTVLVLSDGESFSGDFGFLQTRTTRFNLMPFKGTVASVLQKFLPAYKMLRAHKGWTAITKEKNVATRDPDLFIASAEVCGLPEAAINQALLTCYTKSNEAYHSASKTKVSSLTDAQFDRLKEICTERGLLSEKEAKAPGAAVRGAKTVLPRQMGSLDKIKTMQEFAAWSRKAQGDKVVTIKYDGVSIQLKYRSGKFVAAYTRGDGTEGQDVTKHAALLKFPKELKGPISNHKELIVRAEVICSRSTFKAKFTRSTKNPSGFKNPRNMVAGVLNRNVVDRNVLPALDVFAFDAYTDMNKYQELRALESAGFNVVVNGVLPAKTQKPIDLDMMLKRLKQTTDYDMDGLVVELNDNAKRAAMGMERNSINPAFARAYKPEDGSNNVATEVLRVEWSVSKHGYLKPTIVVKPVQISGVTVQRATAFNAAFVRDNKIGPGTKLTLTRSGDVIPYIVKVDKPTKASLPKPSDHGEWDWNESSVDIVLTDGDNADLRLRKLVHFFTAMGVEHLNEGIAKRFLDSGVDSPVAIAKMSVTDMVRKVDGIQLGIAKRLVDQFGAKLKNAEMGRLMYASGVFGRNLGSTKLRAIYEEYKDEAVWGWKGFTLGDIAASIAQLPGFSVETGKQYAEGLKPFRKFLNESKPWITPRAYVAPKRAGSKLANQVVVFTGFRDAALEAVIQSQGGKIGSSVSSTTTILLVKDKGSTSSKAQKAADVGAKVMTAQEFRAKFKV